MTRKHFSCTAPHTCFRSFTIGNLRVGEIPSPMRLVDPALSMEVQLTVPSYMYLLYLLKIFSSQRGSILCSQSRCPFPRYDRCWSFWLMFAFHVLLYLAPVFHLDIPRSHSGLNLAGRTPHLGLDCDGSS